jgi:hypothetical protein
MEPNQSKQTESGRFGHTRVRVSDKNVYQRTVDRHLLGIVDGKGEGCG